jgi:PKHD-type hydroxylase
MIVLLQNVLSADQVSAILADFARVADGEQSSYPLSEQHGGAIGSALMSHEPFTNGILPTALTPFEFDRHVPGTVIQDRMDTPLSGLGTSQIMRTDAVCVVFLSDPTQYDGGELVIDSSTLPMPLKLPAGNAVVFPATDFHTTTPVSRGERWVAVCGIQSAVRGTREREILTEMWVTLNDSETMHPADNQGQNDGVKYLGKARSNLIRLLAET